MPLERRNEGWGKFSPTFIRARDKTSERVAMEAGKLMAQFKAEAKERMQGGRQDGRQRKAERKGSAKFCGPYFRAHP
jgi:hypothetical protein